MVAIIQFDMTWIVLWSIWLQDVSNSIEFGILIGLPCQIHSESTLIGVLLMCLGPTMFQIIASWTLWCVSIQLEVSVGDANLGSHGFGSPCVFSFIIEDAACLMIAVDVRRLESLEVWIDVLITVGTKSGWCPLDIHDCCG